MKSPRLGRGLSALIGEVEGAAPQQSGSAGGGNAAEEIALSAIRANPAQPRRHFEQTELEELAASIKAHGVLQAILVRPVKGGGDGRYEIIAGERRWRAARLAELKTIPAMVRDVDELQLLEQGIIENVQRTDLNPIEEAMAYEALMRRFGRTQDALAATIGKSRVHIANTLRLLKLPEEARALVMQGQVSAGHARAALGAPDPLKILDQAAKQKLSVRDVEALARKGLDEDAAEVKKAVSKMAGKDVDTEALEADLSRMLGLPVEIRSGPRGGELRIKYRELEQLDDVCRRLTARR